MPIKYDKQGNPEYIESSYFRIMTGQHDCSYSRCIELWGCVNYLLEQVKELKEKLEGEIVK